MNTRLEKRLFGTLFTPEEQQEKKNFFNQTVMKSKGLLKWMKRARLSMKKDIDDSMGLSLGDSQPGTSTRSVRKKGGSRRSMCQ